MLKIDQIELAKLGFNPHELKHLAGDAVVNAKGSKIAEGAFRMVNCGAAIMCTVDAAGKLEADGVTLDKPEDLTVVLSGSFVRKVMVPAGAKKLDTGVAAKDGVTVKLNGAELELEDEANEETHTFWTKDDSFDAVCKDRVVDIVVTADSLGSAAAHDGNINHKMVIKADNDEGLVHFAILANAGVMAGKKPNKASFEVRGAKPWKVLGEKACVALKSPAEVSEKPTGEGGEGSGSGNG